MQPDEQPDDQTLRAALFNVKVPTGMRQRLLDRLRAEAAADAAPQDTSPIESAFVVGNTIAEVSIAEHTVDDAQAASQPQVELAHAAESTVGGELPRAAARLNRREWAIGLAMSLVALAAVGVYQWTRPASTERLARFTLGQLDQLLSDDAVWKTDFDPQLSELTVLAGQLRFNIRPIGFQDRPGGGLADQCRVWKLYSLTTHKVFFVFDFKQANQVQSLTRGLQELNRSSGGWSLVAMQDADRVVVVAVEGRVDSYLYQRQSA